MPVTSDDHQRRRRTHGSILRLAMVAAFAGIALASPVARGDVPTCPELPCSVNRNCSSTGVACRAEDRDCVNRARERDLEVKCEQTCSLPGDPRDPRDPRDLAPSMTNLIYCPADAGRSDSKVVWVLLSLATVLAIAGGAVAWLVLKKKKVA